MIGIWSRHGSLLLFLCLAGCGGHDVGPPTIVEVHVQAAAGIDLTDLSFSPPSAVRNRMALAANHVELEVDLSALSQDLILTHPESCDEEVPRSALELGQRHVVNLAPFIVLGGDRPQLGFDQEFTIEVRPGCREALAGSIEWSVAEGSLADHDSERNGFVFRGHTMPWAEVLGPELPWGLVPISPSRRGEALVSATWRGAGRGPVRRQITVGAIARATGVPSVPPHQRLALGGTGWRVAEKPPDARAELAVEEGVSFLAPDELGEWSLVDADDRVLELHVNRHDQTRLDCGRPECHASITTYSLQSPMTQVFSSSLEGRRGPGTPQCALRCHTVGEPGLSDGGFAHVARELDHLPPRAPGPGAYASLPRALRRLSGVGCTACHGPGAIPAPAARWTILSSGVCATCHDAPPRYSQVQDWRRTRMARSDVHPATRTEPCARCHTTSGFLDLVGVRSGELRVDAPPHAGPLGIACVACHAPHGDHLDRALLRRAPTPASLGGDFSETYSGVCLPCHAPSEAEGLPEASAAALWLGRGGLIVDSGQPLHAPPIHVAVVGGCIGCHSGGAEAAANTPPRTGHSFSVDRRACGTCHDEEPVVNTSAALRARALTLLSRLDGDGAEATAQPPLSAQRPLPPHGRTRSSPTDVVRARALRNVLLVLEDPAAGVHNGPFARALLDEAERALSDH